MSDDQGTVKSKISMDLKNRNKSPAKPGSDSTSKTAAMNNQGEPINSEATTSSTLPHDKVADPSYADPTKFSQTAGKPKGDKTTPRSAILSSGHSSGFNKDNTKSRKKLVFILLMLCLGLVVLLAALIRYESVGHYYYVESTIAPPSDVETKSNALVLGSCVVDFTMLATPAELTKLVHDEYHYKGNSDDYVQTLVRTGCDKDISLPMIHHGSAINAMF